MINLVSSKSTLSIALPFVFYVLFLFRSSIANRRWCQHFSCGGTTNSFLCLYTILETEDNRNEDSIVPPRVCVNHCIFRASDLGSIFFFLFDSSLIWVTIFVVKQEKKYVPYFSFILPGLEKSNDLRLYNTNHFTPEYNTWTVYISFIYSYM